jgi:hypothetical protein
MENLIKQKLGEVIGEASMCWSETPKGIFDSTRASKLVDDLWFIYEGAVKQTEENTKKEIYRRKNVSDCFGWMEDWLNAYSDANGSPDVPKIMEWIKSQPMGQ